MQRATFIILWSTAMVFVASITAAQALFINAETVKAWQEGKRDVLLIDVRLPDEYTAARIPGAINIPAQRMVIEKKKLPKSKATPIIFYCRGPG